MRGLLMGVCCLFAAAAVAEEAPKKVVLSEDMFSVEVKHKGETLTLVRNQAPDSTIAPLYQKTTRGKIQPMHPFAPHAVETIGELELIDYLVKRSNGDDSILLVDSRTEEWAKKGTIPGAVNIPFTRFRDSQEALDVMEGEFGVFVADVMDFSNAKTLVMFCNGVWCGQSPTAIRKLLNLGYPAAKIKYFRGGMQSWQSLGLTVVMP
jgi:rhodanese-related sulfurtransferase